MLMVSSAEFQRNLHFWNGSVVIAKFAINNNKSFLRGGRVLTTQNVEHTVYLCYYYMLAITFGGKKRDPGNEVDMLVGILVITFTLCY